MGNLPGQRDFLWALKTSDINYNTEWKERRFSKLSSALNTSGETSNDKKPKLSNYVNVLEQQTRILASLVPDEILEKVNDYAIRHYDAVFLFGDVSVICAPDLKAVGGIVIDTQLVGPTRQDFLLFVSSQLTFNNRNGGSHITSCILPNLHTIEEKRIEFINVGLNLTNEKHIYVALQDSGYYVVNKSKLETTLCKQFYTFDQTENLILEGANFLLMRYLALIKYIGTFEMTTVYINGDLCRNVYISEGPEGALINNVKCDIIKIQRIIQEKCGITHYCITTLLLSGHIVKQEWQDCKYVLHLNPLIDMEKNAPNKLNKVPAYYEWERDMQLFSKYLDFKTKRLALHKNYYEDHPELKDLIADYCQNILLKKPEDVLEYTIQYFRRFNRENIPFSTYFNKKNWTVLQ